MPLPLLQCENLASAWKTRPFLENIDFNLAKGQFLALLGANGAGKSTLLRALAGILNTSKGRILLNGTPLQNFSARTLARQMAYVPQNAIRPRGLAVEEMVLQGRYPWLSPLGLFARKDRGMASAALELAELGKLAKQQVETLSGGEWQRALLARAICQTTGATAPLLLLDEIASGLDPARAISIFSLLASLKAKNCAILASIHDCNLAAIFATHMLALKKGKILFYGKTRDVFTRENIGRLYEMEVGIFHHPDLGCPQVYPRFGPGATFGTAPLASDTSVGSQG